MEIASKTELTNPWVMRFIWAAVIQGAILVGLSLYMVVWQETFERPEISRIMASGAPGSWFTFGFVVFFLGVIAVAASSVIYRSIGDKKESRTFGALAWSHLILMSVGLASSGGLLMYLGYVGGAASLPVELGGGALNQGQVHEIIGPLVDPIRASILTTTAGAIAGGAAFLSLLRKSNV